MNPNHANDALVRLAIAIDLGIRRVARRLFAALGLGDTPCR